MRQHQVGRPAHLRYKAKRIGRGPGSGKGTTGGKGTKGQKSRRGVHIRPGFEGGQVPIMKRLPMLRGFNNPFRVDYQPVNLDVLEKFPAGATVTAKELKAAGYIRSDAQPVKVLAKGTLTKALTVKAQKFSASAKQKIEAAQGKAEEISATAAAV
ncbi:MAG: 50S ribosomal protein L15 [Chloroflexi bacterium]|nr:50S ribosomal protein L15 [Chloroflexota bacterium]